MTQMKSFFSLERWGPLIGMDSESMEGKELDTINNSSLAPKGAKKWDGGQQGKQSQQEVLLFLKMGKITSGFYVDENDPFLPS